MLWHFLQLASIRLMLRKLCNPTMNFPDSQFNPPPIHTWPAAPHASVQNAIYLH
jgi:hypothetical protein